MTGSALQLGLLGLMRFLPSFLLSLFAGAIVDRYDRRRVLMASQLAPFAGSLVLLVATANHTISVQHPSLPLIYVMVFLVAIGTAFENPARQALIPQLVSRETYHNAVTVHSTLQQLAMIVGPTVGGFVIAASGFGAAYSVHLALVVAALGGYLLVRPLANSSEKRGTVTIAAIREGIQFVWRHQVLLGAMTLDMFAVIFGGAQALLPIYATKILHVGAGGYGLLTSSLSVGAVCSALVLVLLPPVRRTGIALMFTVTAFGLATIAFGLSRSFPLALLFYGLVGASDQVSVIMRQTTIQLATPDALRGRVSAINSLFIGTSNPIGAVESGFVAAIAGAVFSVVSGGIGCIAVVGVVAAALPEMRRHRIDFGAARPLTLTVPVPVTSGAVVAQTDEPA